MTNAPGIAAEITSILRHDRGRLLSALIRSLGSFDLAEEALSDATERALIHWARSGLPDNPKAWLLQVARRAAIDRIRKDQRFASRIPDITRLMEEDEEAQSMTPHDIPDDRLRLIFTCCHPALDEKTRVALTLRTVGGLTTREIARAFLDTEATMGQRLSRAKTKIGAAGIPYRVPDRSNWDDRLASVLTVIYLIFNEGWTAGPGDAPIRASLCDEAIWLARLMVHLAPGEAEIEGLLALMLLSHARFAARLDSDGVIVPLPDQDRTLWDRPLIEEGLAVLDRAVARHAPGPFQIQAAISALHIEAETPERTDWQQILLLYDRLLGFAPSPVIALNRAVALAESGEVAEARDALNELSPVLATYQPFFAAKAHLAQLSGATAEAAEALTEAIRLSKSDSEIAWLKRKLAGLRAN